MTPYGGPVWVANLSAPLSLPPPVVVQGFVVMLCDIRYFNVMSKKPLSICCRAGCHDLTADRYCLKHIDTHTKRSPDTRPSASRRGYNSSYRKQRKSFLVRPGNVLCGRCVAKGYHDMVSTTIHHKDRNPDNNDESNWEAMCRDCHEQLHGRKRKAWDANLIRVPNDLRIDR